MLCEDGLMALCDWSQSYLIYLQDNILDKSFNISSCSSADKSSLANFSKFSNIFLFSLIIN